MKRITNDILEQIFDGITDWYGVRDEMETPAEADEAMQGNDAIAWIDNDTRDAIFGIAFINDVVTQITVLQSTDPELSILDISERIKEAIRNDYDILSGDIMCDTHGLTCTITEL